MSPVTLALIGLVVLFLLMFLRMPISFSMLIVGFLGLLVAASPGAAFNVLTADLWNQFSSYTMSVIPLYILMGEIVFRTGVNESLFNAAYKWLGRFKGGMAATVVLASTGFAAICGSNSATAAAMGTMALPELKKYRYDQTFSAATVAAGGTLGVIIPPSTVLIVIALQTEQSVRQLFVASVIPGLLLALLFLGTVFFLCQRNPELGPGGPRVSLKEKLSSLSGFVPTLLLFAFVMGGLFLGWFTPTESGAFGAFGAMLISLAMRKLNVENLKAALFGTLKSSTMVITLVIGAMVFGRFLAITRLPYEVAAWAGSLQVPPVLILVAVLLVYLTGGALMDALGFLIISIPIFYPTVISLGYDPIWFAVVLCIVTSAGAITPPVGVTVFVVKGLSPEVPLMSIFKRASVFLISYAVLLSLLVAFPQIITSVVR
ncbi:TRAP transporter large permease [Desulfofundulus thermosubterraneus]|uniref:TRAP transporter, DctM subunit n=1 Tax=Desulfofundulus thermosubterraneus DSM 16057 TaxID=1121432 RepID=A0A1M6APJ0_9FIRM|nr:TRAP transporter large permease [Desulfofundulus thermosubterraneus]SHI38429.1 TRAP transporter, DctM subunit [Desulfofundulus thermosubterraneus DSM 16057]